MTCGCGEPSNEHGDPANLVLDKFIDAAEAAGITLEECISNVADTYAMLMDRESVAPTD